MRIGQAIRWRKRLPAKLLLPGGLFIVGFLIHSLARAHSGVPVCADRPSVFMDERTAASHLIAKREPEIPADAPRLVRPEKVVLWVSVDRRGRICDLQPALGHPEVTEAAIRWVKTYWKYRPFLINWKPTSVQFPVTLWLVPSKPKAEQVATAFPAGQDPAGRDRLSLPVRASL